MAAHQTHVQCCHCSLPVPLGRLRDDEENQFCCSGCFSAWELIHNNGLSAFYQMVDSPPIPTRESDSDPEFDSFDEAGFAERFIQIDESTASVTLSIEGIHCAACVWLIEKLPTLVPGVLRASVNWSKATVHVVWDAQRVPLSAIGKALSQLGYTPVPLRVSERARQRARENRTQLIRIGIAGAAAGNNMLIAAAMYLSMFSQMAAEVFGALRIISCLVGLVSFLGPGRVFLSGAWNAIRTRTAHMDLPIALGLTVGTVAGLVNTIRGTGEIYFDSLSILVFLLLVGRWIQFRQQNHAADAIELLYQLTPQRARKIVDGNRIEVAVEDLKTSDLIELLPGDPLPADGLVTDGSSLVDESILTGESKPVKKEYGDSLAAGTQNISSKLRATVTAVGKRTRISKIVELVEQAALEKPRIVEWANRVGGYFVIVVMLLSLVTFLAWFSISTHAAVDHAVALLIVACPCALAIATPLTLSVAIGRLAQRKILVKSGDVLQSLSRAGMVWLDKTGTLTEGRMKVVSWAGSPEWKPLITAIETNFQHPIARAFVEYDCDADERFEGVNAIRQESNGVVAHWDDHVVRVGNIVMMEDASVIIPVHWLTQQENVLAQGLSPIWIAIDDQVVAMAGLGDHVRPESQALVDRLKLRGWTVGMLSGDHVEVVEKLASSLGIERWHGVMTPEDKLEMIRKSQEDFSTVVMVGDGVNDSAALAAATVGIAVQNGAEASLSAAPVYLAKPGLSLVDELFVTSRSVARMIVTNIAVSLSYNVVGVSLAIGGWINPLLAAVLMPVSSLTVVSIALRSRLPSRAGILTGKT